MGSPPEENPEAEKRTPLGRRRFLRYLGGISLATGCIYDTQRQSVDRPTAAPEAGSDRPQQQEATPAPDRRSEHRLDQPMRDESADARHDMRVKDDQLHSPDTPCSSCAGSCSTACSGVCNGSCSTTCTGGAEKH
jgi:hypothetical protein